MFENLFKSKKTTKVTVSPKELFKPALGKLWLCSVRFRPWDEELHDVCIEQFTLKKAEVTNDGIWISALEKDPFCTYGCEGAQGCFDRLEQAGCNWCGFFETKEAAEKCYNETMKKWIKTIQNSLIDIIPNNLIEENKHV